MPTSSQALILRSTDGTLPPISGRRRWYPAVSLQYPLSNVDFTERCLLYNAARREPVYHQLRRAESAPNLRFDISALPGLLRISKISGSLTYEKGASDEEIKVPNIAPLRKRRDGWTTENNILPVGEEGRRKEVLRRFPRDENYTFFPKFRRRVRFIEQGNTVETDDNSGDDINVPVTQNKGEKPKFVKITAERDFRYDLGECQTQEASYFRLVQVSPADKFNFRLVKTFNSEPGSFRLAKTASHEGGDYKLVPADGFESDDFRVAVSDGENGLYNLYQADPHERGKFRLVDGVGSRDTGEFRLLQAAPRENAWTTESSNQRNTYTSLGFTSDSSAKRTMGRFPVNQMETAFAQRPIAGQCSNLIQVGSDASIENSYEFFNDVVPSISSRGRTGCFLPDITQYDSSSLAALHPKQRPNGDLDFEAPDNDMEAFRMKYMKSYQALSNDVCERLVTLGFRKPKDGPEVKLSTIQQVPGSSGFKQGLISEWGTSHFDQWSRTTDVIKPASQSTLGSSSSLTSDSQTRVTTTRPNQKESLLDEVKLKSNYRQWKKKKITAIRMRKELPPKDPSAVCVTLRDNVISHEKLKLMVEQTTGHELLSLQFDPVSVHSLDTDAKSQWILRFRDPSVCESLVENGMKLEGDKLKVKRLDDVMKEEHEAYKFYLIMLEIKQRKSDKMVDSVGKQKAAKQGKMRHTQTQTQTQSQIKPTDNKIVESRS